jgi:hypothetical protein
MLNPNEKEVLQKVFAEMQQVPIFSGVFDAKNGSWEFMHGVACVMEYLAQEISEECYEDFDKKFAINFQKSLDKAKD